MKTYTVKYSFAGNGTEALIAMDLELPDALKIVRNVLTAGGVITSVSEFAG